MKTLKILIVDDDENMYITTKNALDPTIGSLYKDYELDFMNLKSAKDTIAELENDDTDEPEIALIFLDIVMETDDAGFKVVNFLRKEKKNFTTQIIVRSGQAGKTLNSTPQKISNEYEINDFIDKSEGNVSRIRTSAITSLRMYEYLCDLNSRNREINSIFLKFINDYSKNAKPDFSSKLSIRELAKTILNQLSVIYQKDEISISDEALIYLSEIEDIDIKHIFLLIDNAIKLSKTNKIHKKDIQKSSRNIYNKMLWQKNKKQLKILYNELATRNYIRKINYTTFHKHFMANITPDERIDWIVDHPDLIYLFFKLETNGYLLSNFNRFKEIINHFTNKGKLMNHDSLRVASSTNSKVLNLKTNEGYAKLWEWHGDNKTKTELDTIFNFLNTHN